MKKIIFVILVLLFSFNCYALTKEEAYDVKTYLFIQGKTAEKINELFGKLNEGLTYADVVSDKLGRWENRYRGEVEPVPEAAQKLDALMNDYFAAAEQYFKAYRVKDTRNDPELKGKLKELYREIKREEGQLKIEIGE